MVESTHSATAAAVLDANATFYRAFSSGDFAAMSELWAAHAPVACLHPGARALIGRTRVLESWNQILGETPRFELRCERPIAHVFGDAALVTCYEGSGDEPAHLVATNGFVLEGGLWRMVHHQAGPVSVPLRRSKSPLSMN
jgi:hypothetical protein